MNKLRIMVIDDDPFVLKLVKHQILNLGHEEPACFTNASSALIVLTDDGDDFDVVLCDLDMPEMDGVEFIRHLLGTRFTGQLALFSGKDARILQSAERLARAHKLNVLGSLQKPVMPADLARILAGVRDRQATGPRSGRRNLPYEAEALQRALERRELVNHYQPQVCVRSGKLIGVEALVRWKHPEDGLVFPDRFIGLAEESGLINEVAEQVLIAGLNQLGVWDRDDIRVTLSVNVSMNNLTSLDFPEFVIQAVGDAGIPLSRLVLEVTESRLTMDLLSSLDILTRLRLKQVGLSIDDFGTGHSSLAQLRDIPFDELKIDRGFTHGAGTNPSLAAIFNASLGMARQLDMKTVAEGVEDEQDWNFLKHVGCDLAQGYFIGRPMPAEQLPIWHKAWMQNSAGLFDEARK